MRAGLTLLFILMLMIFPVNAVERIKYDRTLSFDFYSPSHLTIGNVYLNNIKGNSHQTIVLDAYGKSYTLNIDSQVNWGWWTFTVNLTYPNGTTASKTVEVLRPFAQDYDVKIQYYWIEADTYFLDIDLMIGVNPLSVVTDTAIGVYDLPLDSYIVFSHVSGSSTVEMDVEIWTMTQDEYYQMKNGSLSQMFSEAAGRALGWTWDQILNAISQIPVVGENFATALEVMGRIVGETFFFVRLILIENWELTVLTYESFAMMYAMQSRNIMTMYRRFVRFHINTAEFLFSIVTGVVRLILDMIKAIGSLIPFT